MKPVAIYLRVSTGEQSNDAQRDELISYCKTRGFEFIEYADKISGAKFTRFGLDRLMADVRKGRLSAVVVVKLDRLGRSVVHLAQLFGELDSHKVALIATSQGIDTSESNPAGRLQMHVLSAVAEFERSLIRERTIAGLNAARARGSVLGRKPKVLTEAQRAKLEAWTPGSKGGIRALASELGVSVGTAHKLIASPH